MDKMKRLGPITDNLNKALDRALQSFSSNTQWTDINNWLLSLETILNDNPSPFINQKIILAKRLSQCTNPILPEKVHECVLKIHQTIFYNMRVSVDHNINEYVKLFSEDIGIYSLSILPYFTHTSVTSHRLAILNILNEYYLDLGRQLIPMLSGLMKAILPVYSQTNEQGLQKQIQKFLSKLLIKSGRRYTIAAIWSAVLKFEDCRSAGVTMLSKFIKRMQFIKGQEDYESSHGFSQEEREIMMEMMDLNRVSVNKSVVSAKHIITEQHQGDVGQTNQVHSQGHIDSPIKQKPQQIKRANTFAPSNALTKIKQQQQHEYQSHEVSQDQGNPLNQNSLTNSQSDLNTLLRKINHRQKPKQACSSESKQHWLESPHPIKLNKVPLMLTPGIELIKEGIDEDINQNNYPNHSTLIVSALTACLQDHSQFIKRSALDFMFSHLRLKSDVLDQQDKKVLIQGVLRLFRKKQISINKRVNRWLFGKQDEENRYAINDKNQFVIPLIVRALMKIFQAEPTDEESSIAPLKIIQNFYMQHEGLIEHTIHDITVDVLRYIFNYSEGYQFSESVLKAGKRFFQNIPSYYPTILKSLGMKFVEGVVNDNDHLAFESIKYIDYCYIKMMHHEHQIEELNYITVSLSYISEGLKNFATSHDKIGQNYYKIYLKDANLLLCNLLSRRKSVQKYMDKQKKKFDQKYLDQTGNKYLPAERIEYQNNLKQKEEKQKEVYIEILDKLEYFFIGLGTVIKATANTQAYEDIYRLSCISMVQLQLHLPQDTKLINNQLPKWFLTIEYGIRVSSPSISLAAIQAMIKCLMNEQSHPIYAQFKTKIMHDKTSKTGSDFQNLALQKLWSLLDFPHMHNSIIDLIVAYSKFFPYQFTQTVKKSFQTSSDPEKQASIQRFSHFWRLTGFKYKDLILSNRQFAELNKVGLFKMLDFLDDNNPLVRHAAKNWMIDSIPLFHRVLEPLFHQLMKVCGDWYTTPKGLLIIKNTYDTSIIFSTFRRIRSLLSNGSYSFLRFIYQKQLPESLSELREKVTTVTQSILSSSQKENIMISSSDPNNYQRQPVLPKSLEVDIKADNFDESKNAKKKMTYIDMLIIISVKFVEGHTIQSMGIDFYNGNSGVNTSAIELLESLINYIDNPDLCYRLVNYIMQPLSKILSQSVTNKEYITQIQLLNIFRTIFFNSAFRKKGEVQQVRLFFKDSVFTQKYFLLSILKGLHTPFAYVRAQFINFITSCIPLIADFLQPEKCTQCIKQILFTYYKIIKEIRFSLIEEVLEEEESSLEKINEVDGRKKQDKTVGLSRIIQFEIRAKKEEKFINISGNLQQMAKTNEILSILHGVSAILNYFYDFDKMNISDMKFEFSNPYTFFDTFKSFITLGIASSVKTGKLIQRTQFLHNMQTCQSILKDMSPVYQTILRAWPLSEEFVRIATQQFTSIGSRVFNFGKFSKYNHVLKELIGFVNKEKQTIWGKIFSILQPMFYKFPKQITEIYLNLWIKDCTNAGGYGPEQKTPSNEKLVIKPRIKSTQFLMKIVETIIVSNFPMNIVIHAFLQTDIVEQIKTFYEKKKKQRTLTTLNCYIAQVQTKLLYFLYIYFMYLNIDEKNLNKDSLIEIWSVIMKSIKPFMQSKNPSTAMWILDIINMCATKYSPKQILINERFKTDLHGIVNQLLKFVASVASKSQVLFYQDPAKIPFDADDFAQQKFRIITPIPPSLFQIYKKKQKDRNQIDNKLFGAVRPGDIFQLQITNRLWCFKMLKKIGFQVIQNVYLSEKMHFGVIRACQWIQIILPVIEDKSKQNMVFAESASQVLFNLLDGMRIVFIKPLRASILRIFNKDDFFICNKKTLQYWAQIIDWIVSFDKHNQTFTEYLNKVSLSSSYFTNESEQNKKRIKSFERICFILYSGQRDKYANKIKGLLEKIADVIKIAQSAHPALLILVLFSIRILILKLSQISLNQLFIDIWPMILAFLMQIFSKKLVKVEIVNEISRNPNLLLAALKLIEMISVANLGEFAHHQWVFIYDYFGVKLSLLQNSAEVSQILSQRPQLTELISYTRTQVPSSFYFKPYIFNFMPHHSISYTPENHPKQQNNQEKQKIGYEPQNRKIIVKNSFVRSDDQVKCYVLLLTQYLIHTNEYRMTADPQQIEEVIINDFIMLDNFIHKI